jgi:hypothetical protein
VNTLTNQGDQGKGAPNLIDFDVFEDAPVSNPISFDPFESNTMGGNNDLNSLNFGVFLNLSRHHQV